MALPADICRDESHCGGEAHRAVHRRTETIIQANVRHLQLYEMVWGHESWRSGCLNRRSALQQGPRAQYQWGNSCRAAENFQYSSAGVRLVTINVRSRSWLPRTRSKLQYTRADAWGSLYSCLVAKALAECPTQGCTL